VLYLVRHYTESIHLRRVRKKVYNLSDAAATMARVAPDLVADPQTESSSRKSDRENTSDNPVDLLVERGQESLTFCAIAVFLIASVMLTTNYLLSKYCKRENDTDSEQSSFLSSAFSRLPVNKQANM